MRVLNFFLQLGQLFTTLRPINRFHSPNRRRVTLRWSFFLLGILGFGGAAASFPTGVRYFLSDPYSSHYGYATAQELCDDYKEVFNKAESNFQIIKSTANGPEGGFSESCLISQVYLGPPDPVTGTNPGDVSSGLLDVWTNPSCPSNSIMSTYGNPQTCSCRGGFFELAGMCVANTPKTANQCEIPPVGFRVGHPILPASGEKYRSEVDFSDNGAAPLIFSRIYRSSWGNDNTRKSGVLSRGWMHNHSTKLEATPKVNPNAVTITFSDGDVRVFAKAPDSSNWVGAHGTDSLIQSGDGAWAYRNNDSGDVFNFNASGLLQTQVARNGWATAYTYNAAGLLATVINGFGRTLTLAYNDARQLTSVVTPDGRTVAYSYDSAGRLFSVTYPDGKSRSFVYENTALPGALTGILDESGVRFATFAYESAFGRAISTELAGGADRYEVSYNGGSPYRQVHITDPLGTSRAYFYGTAQDKLAVVGSSGVSGQKGGREAYQRTQDVNGLVTSEIDFKNSVTTTSWDVARGLPTVVTRASGTPEAQTTTTQWHPIFALPVLKTEAGRGTAYTYDTYGNLLSQTVTDTATGKAQLWQWTYNALGLVISETEPNGAVNSYVYDAIGNRTKSTNALGHETLYGYDNANRLISRTGPNGLVTTYSYDARDRLLAQTAGGLQSASFTYKPFGGVETVTLPQGLVLSYTYDDAHRVTGWSNNRGESGAYTLDAMGNRTTEQVKDTAGSVAWKIERLINVSLNRPNSEVEGPNWGRTFEYDENGDLKAVSEGGSWSLLLERDGLRRAKAISDGAFSNATLKYNALGAAIEVKDFNGVATTYGRDAQGNATSETSADVGAASTQYDNLGLPSQITDALGQATTITRDALGRPTGLVFADGKTTTLRYDLTTNSKGYLSEVIDRSGTTEYTRDVLGRVTLKKQTLANGGVQQVSYAYNPNGTLASIGYPNGSALTHAYDATGRLTGLSLNGIPLVTGIAWNPLGQPTAWTWAFASPATAASRSYDTAGRMTATDFSSYVYDAAGRITSLTQNLYQPGDTDPTHGTIGSGNVSWTVDYNPVGRITGFNATGNTAGFGYDANGNRSSSTRVLSGLSTSRTYTVGATSNQLTGFTQSINGASNTSVTYGYNANGDLLSDGLRSYTYDAEGSLAASTTGATDTSPTTRYAHNALGQRVFKTEPLYPPSQGDEADPSFMQSLVAFFTKLWSPSTTQAEQLGYAYVYDEQGTLLAEAGSGGTNSGGQAQYIYLPTANGPMPIAAVINGATYAVHSDHLNTPRKLTNASGQAVWQWSYSAFGEDKPTLAKNRFANLETTPNPGTTGISEVKFNLRYPGQYADEESGLFYNYFRSYDPRTGRYPQGDRIGLGGGWNRFLYAGANPLRYVDPLGLWSTGAHNKIIDAFGEATGMSPAEVASMKAGSWEADHGSGYQDADHAFMHAMSSSKLSKAEACRLMNAFVGGNLEKAGVIGQFSQIEGARRLGFALHAIMDSTSPAHRGFQKWQLSEAPRHGDFPFTSEENEGVVDPYIPETVQRMLDAMKGGTLDCSCY